MYSSFVLILGLIIIPFDRYCKEDVVPKVFVTFMRDIKKMKFAERPDYNKLRKNLIL